MQCKFKLGFLALITSNFFVKAISADELVTPSKKDFSLPEMVSEQLEEIDKKQILGHGNVEIVTKKKTAASINITKGLVQRVQNEGETKDIHVYSGGKQIVTGTGSSAYNTKVYGQDGTPGQQIVHSNGSAIATDVMDGGIQKVGGKSVVQQGGLSINTTVFEGGRQRVLAGGKARNTVLNGGTLEVDSGGVVDSLTISSDADARIYAGAILKGAVTVNDFGKLVLYVHENNKHNINNKIENIILNGKDSLLELVADRAGKKNFLIKKLNGNGRFAFSYPGNKTYYSALYINDLSGNIDFYFNVDFAGKLNDSLFIANGQGDHTVSIPDTGIDIITSSSSSFLLITDESGGAHFTLKNHANAKINIVDSGTYVYHLQHTEGRDDSKVWYLTAVKRNSTSLDVFSNTDLSLVTPIKPKEDALSSQDSTINPYENSFSLYTSDVYLDEDKSTLQDITLMVDETIFVLDDGTTNFSKRAINGVVEAFGKLYVDVGGFSENTIVLRDGAEIIREQGTSEFTTVQVGGKQSVEGGGTAMGTTVYGGTQSVFGEGEMDGVPVSSRAYNTHIYGQDDAQGEQKVYDDGIVLGTKVMAGGMQTLAKWFPDDESFALKSGGIAMNTEVFAEGQQRILEGGKAYDVILHPYATQEIHAGGYINNLEIKEGANSWALVGSILEGKTVVNDLGQLHLYVGESNYRTITEDINLTGEKAQLYLVANHSDGHNSWIQKLNGVGEVIFTSDDSLYYSNLYIDTLSGSIYFYLNVSLAEKKGDCLFIKNGSGFHTISVVDSGFSIADPTSIVLDLIFDESGQAHFTLKDISGVKIGAVNGEVVVDGGTYVYALKEKNNEDGQYKKIWYLAAVSIDKTSIKRLQSTRTTSRRRRSLQDVDQSQPVAAFSLEEPVRELSHSNNGHPRSGRRRPALVTPTTPSFENQNNEIPRAENNSQLEEPDRVLSYSDNGHLRSGRRRPALMTPTAPSSIENQNNEIPHVGNDSQFLSPKQESIASPTIPSIENQDDKNETSSFDNASNTSVSLIDQIVERPNGQSSRLPQEQQEIRISDFLTSPSTDAVLSMSVVPGIIFYNELQAVRAGRGIINGSQTTSSFWTQAIKHKEHIATGHIDFKLDQTGIILGVNGLSELMSGEFYIGGFGSYDQARVAHARKGTSSINSYSVGAYATYFDYSGWYLDAVLKYNNYQNDLNAVSTNGLDIHGNYNQWAVGASLETGYRFKLSQQSWMRPYGGLTWLQVANKEIKLSNGMMGDLSRLTSLQSEVGVSVGYEFGSDTKTPSVAYIMASWVRENITKNYTTINKQHKFITDLSGHAGKLGIGLNSSISDRLMVFAEASYLQGQKVKRSFQGTLGLRYSF
ncbi:BafA family autotransporter [Bartonella sp. B30(2025)]